MSDSPGEQCGPAFRLPVRVYYEDTDAGGVVYYANYLSYLERARTEWLRAAGYGQTDLAHERGLLFAVRSLSIEYHAPARLDDLLDVVARVARIGGASLDFEQSIARESTELCRAQVRVACIEADSFRPRALPADLKGVFAGDR